jgi:8-amino-7-oxononanoate synthase
MKSANELLITQLNERKAAGLLRETKSVDALIDFCSNDYLGLARSQALTQAMAQDFAAWVDQQPAGQAINGSTGSRLISGHSELVEIFESQCAAMHQAEAALLFGSGYEANLGLISAIAQKDHVIFCDKLLHASLIDGLRLSAAERRIFKHNDLEDLVHLLEQYPSETTKWVVVESIYSMDGDQAPLEALLALREKFGFELIVDEAHAGGIYGSRGEGLGAAYPDIFARVITFGKAWGNAGAAVLGSNVLKQFLINFARPFIYSTAPTPEHVRHLLTAMHFVQQAEEAREQLKSNISFFKENQQAEAWGDSETAIQTFFVSGNEAVRKLAQRAQDAGFAVKPIVYPTVAKGKERIRITLTAQAKQVDMLALIQILESHA